MGQQQIYYFVTKSEQGCVDHACCSFLLPVLLRFGVLTLEDEGCDVVVYRLQQGLVGIDHVPGFIKLKFDILLQFGRDGQVMHFINA
jgi:hypothetical protein